jgi:uncharacterized membrane protein YqjE
VVDNKVVREKSLGAVVSDVKSEFKEFASTRLEMLMTEMKEKANMIKIAVPFIAIGLVFLAVGFLVLTGALVTIVAVALGGTMGMWALAFLIVGVGYCAFGAVSAAFAVQQLKSKGLAPKHTLRVLKQDQVWLRTEAQAQM